MLCSRCEHPNPEENRYCGRCGNRLESAQPVAAGVREPDSEPHPDEPFRPASAILGLDSGPPRRQPESSITGPSFLGLGSEQDPSGKSYLLVDDEPRSHRGLWAALVLLVLIALVGLRFRTEVREFGTELRQRVGPLYADVLARVNPQPPATPATPAPTPNPSPVAGEASAAAPAPDLSKDATAANAPPPKVLIPNDAAGKTTSADEKPESAQPAKSDADTTKDVSEATASPSRPAKARQARRTAVETASSGDTELLRLSRKYIHGEGVRRDCATGLAYLRKAMQRPSAEALSQMGGLYATGTCVPLDRVAAYRYFSSALQMSPNNLWLAQECDHLYAQMSSAERRRADRQ